MRFSIYTITCKDPLILHTYVGKTAMSPSQRFSNHKSMAKYSDRKLYKIINEYGGMDNWDFNVIEEFYTIDQNFPREREKYYCDLLKPSMNTNIPNRDCKQWRIDNREYYNDYMNKYMKNKYNLKKELKNYLF